MSKILGFLDKYFHQIFNNSHFFYTICFLFSSLITALLSFIPGPNVGNFILFLVTTLSITFIFLMFEGLIPQLEKILFSTEKRFDRRKIFCFILNYLIAFIIMLPYFLAGSSTQLQVQFLGWDIILPVIFLIVYFGWNLIQIFYLKFGFEDISIKVNDKVDERFGFSKKKTLFDLLFLIVALVFPVLIQLATFFGFLHVFAPQAEPFIWYVACNIIILLIIFITSWRLTTLFYRSRKIGSSNSYSSMLYILIWLIIWFRSFSFFNALRGIVQTNTELEILTRFIDILLMLITAFFVLRSLGEKVYDSVLLNMNNMAFFLFSFMLLYIEGQIIMITGAGSLTGVFADRNQINLINNFLIIIITISFYWWFSEHSLEIRGFIVKKKFYPDDVALIVNQFKDFLEMRDKINKDKIRDNDVQNFLDSKNIITQPKEPIEDKDNFSNEYEM